MTGVDFVDIIVRRSVNKGTSTIDWPVMPSDFMGKQQKQKSSELLDRAGDPWLRNNGTSKFKLSQMRQPTAIDAKGRYISTGKGTARIKI